MKKVTTVFKNFLKDESGQGATEYILLLVVVVALAMLFKGKIIEIVTEKLAELKQNIMGVTADGG